MTTIKTTAFILKINCQDRLICLNTALWSVNSMLNSEDPTQWYSKLVRIEKVGFPWACLNSFTNIISCWPDLTGCLHFDPCCEIAYRFYNSGVMNELRQAYGKPTFSIRTTLLYHCVGSLLFNIEFTVQSAVFKQMSLSIGPDVLCNYSVY